MNLERLVHEIHSEAVRVWRDARFLILEDLPFYRKLRILLAENLFVEIRVNARNNRISYALVRSGKRIAGFDNLGAWHLHPFGNPDSHRKVPAPTPKKVFAYFKDRAGK